MGKLAGKVALVTGAGSPRGIGFATAQQLATAGAMVILTDRDEASIAQALAAGEGDHGAISTLPLDVTSEEQWAAAYRAIVDRHGRLDILVNNAGRALMQPVTGHSVADFDAMVSVNLKGVFLGCRGVIPLMRDAGGGAIINVSSVAGVVGVFQLPVYSATKGAIRLFSKALAIETAPFNIRCNSVHPGMIDTDFMGATAVGNPEASQQIQAAIPLGRLGKPSEIAGLIAWLASDEAAYATGAEFVIDGGYSAQ